MGYAADITQDYSFRVSSLAAELLSDLPEMMQIYPEGIDVSAISDYLGCGRRCADHVMQNLERRRLPGFACLKMFHHGGVRLLWGRTATPPQPKLSAPQAALLLQLYLEDGLGRHETHAEFLNRVADKYGWKVKSLNKALTSLARKKRAVLIPPACFDQPLEKRSLANIHLLRRPDSVNPYTYLRVGKAAKARASAKAKTAAKEKRRPAPSVPALQAAQRALQTARAASRAEIIGKICKAGPRLAKAYPESLSIKDLAQEFDVSTALIRRLIPALLDRGWTQIPAIGIRLWPPKTPPPAPALLKFEAAVLFLLCRLPDAGAPVPRKYLAEQLDCFPKEVGRGLKGLLKKGAISSPEPPRRGTSRPYTAHRDMSSVNPDTRLWAERRVRAAENAKEMRG